MLFWILAAPVLLVWLLVRYVVIPLAIKGRRCLQPPHKKELECHLTPNEPMSPRAIDNALLSVVGHSPRETDLAVLNPLGRGPESVANHLSGTTGLVSRPRQHKSNR